MSKLSLQGYFSSYLVVLLVTALASTAYSLWVFRSVVLIELPPDSPAEVYAAVRSRLLFSGLVFLTPPLIALFIFYRRLTRGWGEMLACARQFTQGDFSRQVSQMSPITELDSLAQALNRIGFLCREKMERLEVQRRQLDSILSSMVEGVLVLDPRGRIQSVNSAAIELLEAGNGQLVGRGLNEVIDSIELRELMRLSLGQLRDSSGEVHLPAAGGNGGGSSHTLQVRISPFHNRVNELAGILVVLHDVTQLKRAASVQRDFVANVSHELKTPITAIKGFVETLMDGAMSNSDTLKRFLRIISVQAERLSSLVEDLLHLSRLEGPGGTETVSLREESLTEIVLAAAEICSGAAKEKEICLRTSCPEGLRAVIDRALVEQALVNLVDNAIKYSPSHTEVEVRAMRQGEDVVLQVIDQGLGIEEEHLPRIFERFYRVDKARSRRLGGTGLGLAIVKHIAESHQGRVTVESRPSKGSTFAVFLPAGDKQRGQLMQPTGEEGRV